MITLRPYQEQLKRDVYNAWTSGARNVVMRLPTGGGKCLAPGTPVLMYDGTVKSVESIVIGDRIMGPDSLPRNVLSTCSGYEQMYDVIPTKGETYRVNESHILSLRHTETKSIQNVSVKEYLNKSKYWKHCHKGWRTEIDFIEKKVEIDPYFLGLWLGDGNSSGPAITTGDDEILLWVHEFTKSHDLNLTIGNLSSGKAVGYRLTGKKGKLNLITDKLRKYDLINNKHIPQEYKSNSKNTRLKLLAGIIDSDGHYTGKGFDLIFKSEKLAQDVCFLARSLGFAAYVTKAIKSAHKNHSAMYNRIHISGHIDIVPCLLDRKKPKARRQKKNVLNVGITVRNAGYGKYHGFEIDGDQLFVLGDFTVTHNTAILSVINGEHRGGACIIAHRHELVGQLSLALARNGLTHDLIAADKNARAIAHEHVIELGRSFYNPNSHVKIASVDTLVKRDDLAAWEKTVTLWTVDEAHHLVEDNKWSKAIARFTHPECRGLMPTATPVRADGRGLGRRALGGHGFADAMVFGPSERWLIENGYLCDFDVACPPSDMQVIGDVGASGDWSTKQLREAVKRSHIVGDVVQTYLKLARGRLGITFSTDIETAGEIAEAYRAAGVSAEVLTGKTDSGLRRSILARYKARQVMQLVVVDIVSEGFDLPAMEVASSIRKTESLALFMQQFGRILRPSPGKDKALWIDHVGNVVRHQGTPDYPREWTLASRDKKSRGKGDGVPIRVCMGCWKPYERRFPECPFCGEPTPLPVARSSPEQVEGDLHILDRDALDVLRGRVAEANRTVEEYGAYLAAQHCPPIAIRGHQNRLIAEQAARAELAVVMGQWGGPRRAAGLDDRVIQREFWLTFGMDVMTAQTLNRADTEALAERVRAAL